MDPFSAGLWAAVSAAILATALCIALTEWMWPSSPGQENGLSEYAKPRTLLKLLYHAIAVQLGGEDYEWLTSPGRLLRLGVLFFALVLSNTYVANLAAFLSRPSFTLGGPTSIHQMRQTIACLPDADGEARQAFLGNVYEGSWQECTDRLRAGAQRAAVDIIVANEISLTTWGQQQCCSEPGCEKPDDLGWAKDVIFGYDRFGFLVYDSPGAQLGATMGDKDGAALTLSAVISLFIRHPAYSSLFQEVGLDTRPCVVTSVSETDPISFDQMAGLFIVLAVVCSGALVSAALGHLLLRSKLSKKLMRPTTCEEVTTSMTDGEMLKEILHMLKAQKDHVQDGSGKGFDHASPMQAQVIPIHTGSTSTRTRVFPAAVQEGE